MITTTTKKKEHKMRIVKTEKNTLCNAAKCSVMQRNVTLNNLMQHYAINNVIQRNAS